MWKPGSILWAAISLRSRLIPNSTCRAKDRQPAVSGSSHLLTWQSGRAILGMQSALNVGVFVNDVLIQKSG